MLVIKPKNSVIKTKPNLLVIKLTWVFILFSFHIFHVSFVSFLLHHTHWLLITSLQLLISFHTSKPLGLSLVSHSFSLFTPPHMSLPINQHTFSDLISFFLSCRSSIQLCFTTSMNASGAVHRQPALLSPLWGQDEENVVTASQLLDLSF